MKEVTKVGIMSLAKLQAVLMTVMGLIIGVIYGLVVFVFGLAAGEPVLASLGFVVVIVAPIFYGVLGFVFGALAAAVYNLAARWVGGVEIELK